MSTDGKSLNGRVIEFRDAGDLAVLPLREAYCDRAEMDRNDDIIAGGPGALLFMPVGVKEITDRAERKYVLMLSGILTDGRKTVVMVRGIVPYFDVRRPDAFPGSFADAVRKTAGERVGAAFLRADTVLGRRAMGYEDEPHEYCRLFFATTWARKETLNYFRNVDDFRDTANDDPTHYERVACRSAAFTMCGWNEIRKFERRSDPHCTLPVVFHVNVADFIAYTAEVGADRTIVETHDIETYSPTGSLPRPVNPADHIFMIAKTYHWKDSAESLLRVCVVTGACAAVPDALVITCRDEADLLRCALGISGRMRPDYICGFNDGDYDWPWIIARCADHNLLPLAQAELGLEPPGRGGVADIMKWYVADAKIKIDATTTIFDQKAFRFFGYIPIDVRTVMRKLYPRVAKSSLKSFLAILGLAGKEDMDIKELFAIRRGGDGAAMRRVAEYCITDAFRCQEIMLRTNTLNDYREVSNLAYTTLYDAVYIAGGAKVRNLAYAEAERDGIKFSAHTTTNTWNGKFPGGYVYRPDTGMITPKLSMAERVAHDPRWADIDLDAAHTYIAGRYAGGAPEGAPPLLREFMAESTHYPVAGLDFNALYPSIIMTYNLSPERMITSDAQFADLKRRGYDIYEDSFSYCEKTVVVRSVRHDTWDGIRSKRGGEAEHGTKFGLYPRILLKLKAGRTAVKKRMGDLAAAAGAAGAAGAYQYTYLDSKQKALKVIMNTFYGESGSKKSPLFMIEVCGGVTSAGRRNLRGVGEFVKSMGCRLYYGDTDSVYISCPERHFRAYDAAYFAGAMAKIDYSTHLVRTTFGAIDEIRAAVNAMLIADNGTEFLAMAYEEVLFPMGLFKKKTYAGVAHVREIDFKIRDDGGGVFTRGMAMDKLGVSGLLKIVCGELLRECLDLCRWRDPMRIVLDKIDEIYRRDWPLDNFRQSAVYRPEKKNVAVATFRRRMARRGLEVPAPNERFEYVVTIKRQRYDARGHIVKQAVADKWEYAAGAADMRIDLAHYLKGGVVAQFAQFISYYPEFRVEATGQTEDEYDTADKKSLEAANKYLQGVCKMHNGEAAAPQGRVLMAARRQRETAVRGSLGDAGATFVKSAGALSRAYKSCLGRRGCNEGGTAAVLYDEMRAMEDMAKIYAAATAYSTRYLAALRAREGRMDFASCDKIVAMLSSSMALTRRIEEDIRHEIMENEHVFRGALERGEAACRRDEDLPQMIESAAIAIRFCDVRARLHGVMTYIANTEAIIAAAKEQTRIYPAMQGGGGVIRNAAGFVLRDKRPRPPPPRGPTTLTRAECMAMCEDMGGEDFGM